MKIATIVTNKISEVEQKLAEEIQKFQSMKSALQEQGNEIVRLQGALRELKTVEEKSNEPLEKDSN